MIYKAKCKFGKYNVGDVVPDLEAEAFLKRYKVFEHQDILERVEAAPAPKKEEAPKPATKKTTKKKSTKKKLFGRK